MPTLTISEHQATVLHGIQVLRLPAIATQTLAIGGTSTQSTQFADITRVLRLHSDVACRVTVGADPVADGNDVALSANQTEYFDITEGGGKLAVIAY